MEGTLLLPAYAKINLALDVLGRRPDGYHEVEMIMQSIALHDLVLLKSKPGEEITIHCSNPAVPVEENLARRAALLLQRECGVKRGAEIRIKKEIPVAAGLAGGSTDAAAVLRGLNRLWGLGLDRMELMELGRALGADVPYCVQGGTCLARGIGEILTRLPALPPVWIILAKPPGGLATGAVYGGLDLQRLRYRPDIPALLRALREHSLAGIAAHLGNVLQGVSEKQVPEIAPLQQEMMARGALGSLMTGSGPTVFGLVREEVTAAEIAKYLRQGFPTTAIIITRSITPEYGEDWVPGKGTGKGKRRDRNGRSDCISRKSQ